jgi:hypothetical protein
MVDPKLIFGRLGNSLFQYATLYAKSRDEGTDFYFQDPKYFEEYEYEIQQLFGQDIKPIDMVSIHVRRGGNPINKNEPAYHKNPFYTNLCGTDYYERAIELFPSKDFLVFSDDIEWCKHNLKGKQFTFCEEKDEIKALNLMAGCKDNIIANSSFSWWGAYLNPNLNKKVIAPKSWYRDGLQRTVCPPNWELI